MSYCIAPNETGICGKKLPCKTHPDQSNYQSPARTVCVVQRRGNGSPGVCGLTNCTKHKSKVSKSTNDHKRKRVVKVNKTNKRRKVLDINDKSYSKSVSDSDSDSNSDSDSDSNSYQDSDSDSYQDSDQDPNQNSHNKSNIKFQPIPLELEPSKPSILELYAEIERQRQKLFKMEFKHSKYISKLISAVYNNDSESSIDDN